MAITAPYNFVPLNKYVYMPDWVEKVSHDIPFEDGEDGTIDVIIKNVSPLFIRNASKTGMDEFSTHVVDRDGNKHYFIPATTIKGMLRSVMEVFSFAGMNRYDDDYFAYRIMSRDQSDGKGYAKKMENVKCGWLSKEEDKFFLTPCATEFEKISYSEIREEFPRYDSNKTAKEKQELVKNDSGLYPITRVDYRLVCTGPMNNKEHEYLFPCTTSEKRQVSSSVKQAFLTVHKPTPLFETYYFKNLKEGLEIPVFFKENGKGEVESIGLSRMYRYPYKKNVSAGIQQAYYNKEGQSLSKGRDLCQAIWGYIDGNQALKGRVQVGHAFVQHPIANEELKEPISGILGKPAASYYPLYLKQTGGSYVTYDNSEIEIAGRKRYRIHKGDTVTGLLINQPSEKREKENEKVKCAPFRPLPSGLSFKLKISVHNLRKVEIGALLSSITFHQSKAFHNIGLAKGYGYGKVDCYIDTMNGFKFQKEEYLSAFENELSQFLYNLGAPLWSESEQVKALVNIANEHDNADLKMMGLKEYGKYKNNSEFDTLKEPICRVTTYLDSFKFKGEIARKKIEFLFDELYQAEANEQFLEAITCCENILKQLKGFYVEDIELRIEALNRKVLEESKKKELIEEEKRLAMNRIPLSDKLKDQAKILTVLGGLKTWMKANDIVEWAQSDKDVLKMKLKELYVGLKPKDQKVFHNYKQWKGLDVAIGDELANEWVKEITQ